MEIVMRAKKSELDLVSNEQAKTCSRCHVERHKNEFYNFKRKDSESIRTTSWCKMCSKKWNTENYRKSIARNGMSFTSIRRTQSVRSFLAYLRGKAIQRKKGQDVISLDALELLWVMQGGKCALTGWDLTMELGRGTVQTNCSIDRIDSKIGYEVGNVQLVSRAANVAKNNMTQSEFLAMCKSVVRSNDD
jgi:hypothetical protein